MSDTGLDLATSEFEDWLPGWWFIVEVADDSLEISFGPGDTDDTIRLSFPHGLVSQAQAVRAALAVATAVTIRGKFPPPLES